MIKKNFTTVIDILKNISKKERPRILGRWNTGLSQQQLIRRIELANEDHCGPCGGENIKKMKT
tara:strand:+ start:54 stop:242 length:189 start_codon:yes stop_codon:yes gene_type:complete